MPWEVEQKFRLLDSEPMVARLTALGAVWGSRIEQVDRYFQHPQRDFARTDEALRLRRVGDQNFVTYKGPRIDRETKTRTEIELPLVPGIAAAEQYAALLEALSFSPAGIVHKWRLTGELAWGEFTVQLAVDDVAGLGGFLELEIEADDKTLAAAQAAIRGLSAKLDLSGQAERRSYLEMLLSQVVS
jgi:adenylate cyclase class 2